MKMKRLLIATMAALMTVSGLMARNDDEVIVTKQLTTGQRNALPEKTIIVEMKRLAPAKNADTALLDAITQVMDTIASEDYQNRTFVLMLEPKDGGDIAITVHSDDIVTRGNKNASVFYGSLEHSRYHFVLLTMKGNESLLEQTFKRQGKVKFVQEFEFVDYRTPRYPTSVIGRWSPGNGLQWQVVSINEDPTADRDSFDRPAHAQD